MGRQCDSFKANVFCKLRCQNCYKTKDQHSEDALEKSKMSRKVKAQGFLYVAPSNIDFSLPSHTSKRWQRRYFKLYDDGELSYGLDNATMPATKMDMNRCIRVCEAEAITGHAHSILVAFCVDDLKNAGPSKRVDADGEEYEEEPHPAVCYMKADTTDEIRWWQHNLQTYVNQQNIYSTPAWYRRPSPNEDVRCEPTVIQVNDSGSRRSSPCSSRCSTPENKLYTRSIDLGSRQSLTDTSSHHGTVRSVKNRSKQRTRAVEAVETVEISRLMSPEVPDVPLPEAPINEKPQISGSATLSMFRPVLQAPTIDTSHAHTLRKGWLMLRGRSDNEWIKQWVVLAGLSLKMYKDVWLEDSSEPLVSLDLKDCVNVYPSETAKHYGIEIKCKRTRYILSAMTPGIRDSWIQALQQNLHNPSPTYVDNCPSVDGMSIADSEARRKKHIAYVAPESHHSNSMMDGESSTSEDEDELMSPLGTRRTMAVAHRNSISVSESSDDEATDRRRASSPPTTLRRRSPLSRVKDKSTKALRRRSSHNSISSKEDRHKKRMQLEEQDLTCLRIREKTLRQQVENLRDQLRDANKQLVQTKSENDELRKAFGNCDQRSLDELRKSLNDAEDEIKRKQREMDVLRDKLHSPTLEEANACPGQLTARLVNLLQTQVGGISKFLHSAALDRNKFAPLRPMADALIRKVAEVSMEPEEAPFEQLEEIFHDVIKAYEALSSLLIVAPRVATKDSATLTEHVERDLVELNAVYLALLREVGYVYEARCTSHQSCPATDQCYLKIQYVKCLHVVRCISAVLQTLFSNVQTLELSPFFSLNLLDALISRARVEIKHSYQLRSQSAMETPQPDQMKNIMASVYLYKLSEEEIHHNIEDDLKEKLIRLQPCTASLEHYKDAAVNDHDQLYQNIVHLILVINRLIKTSSLQEEEPKEEIIKEAQNFWNNLRETVFSKRLDEADWFSVFGQESLQTQLVEKLDSQVWNVFLAVYEGDVRTALDANRLILKAILSALLDILKSKCGMVSQKKRDSWSLTGSPHSPKLPPSGDNRSNANMMINAELRSIAEMLFIWKKTKDPVEQPKCEHKSSREYEDDREDLLDRISVLEEKNQDTVYVYERKTKHLESQLQYEEEQRKKLLEEIQNMREMNEQTLAALRHAESERVTQLKVQHESEMEKLREEHEREMEEDKIAMKRALDAVRRVHEEELAHTRQQACTCSEGCSTTSDDTRASESSHVADRLKSISAQYSAKCLEHSQLEEKVSTLMSERREAEARSEIDMKRLQKEIRTKDDVIEELKEKVDQLEKKLLEKGASAEEIADYLHRSATKRSRSRTPIRFRQANQPVRTASRRSDVRFHSNPAIPVMRDPEHHGYNVDEVLRHSLAVPVRERRKFFEHIAEYQMSF
ncbi:hypothetical protein QR680_009912 [Steinernema hermaphroditum]|uniref:PH domain-containing protein n=1 Tax=Steinernema hermaphroditum TaxID=289476 RepID=A0AA39MAA0_9BILA|nr:hypothetical protein QR680_009912 [Steinernema hermaphroditum]